MQFSGYERDREADARCAGSSQDGGLGYKETGLKPGGRKDCTDPRKNSGDNGERDPPVPIPNTEVKPFSADGTWLETTRESRTLPDSTKKETQRMLGLFSYEQRSVAVEIHPTTTLFRHAYEACEEDQLTAMLQRLRYVSPGANLMRSACSSKTVICPCDAGSEHQGSMQT